MTLTELKQAVAHLYPSAIYGVTWTANTSSTDASIALWDNSIGAQPTDTQLSTALTSAQLANAQAEQGALLQKAYQGARYATPVAVTIGSASVKFPVDQESQLDLMGALVAYTASTAPASVPVVDASGAVHDLTYAQLQAVGLAIANQSVAAKSKLLQLQAQVKSATTVPDVQAVVWG